MNDLKKFLAENDYLKKKVHKYIFVDKSDKFSRPYYVPYSKENVYQSNIVVEHKKQKCRIIYILMPLIDRAALDSNNVIDVRFVFHYQGIGTVNVPSKECRIL